MKPDQSDLLTRTVFKNVHPISEHAYAELKTLFTTRSVAKNELFIEAGQRNHSEYLVLDGYCRSHLLNPEGDDITLSFFREKSILPPHVIRTRNGVSLLNFQALTALELLEFDAGAFLKLMIDNMEIREMGNTILKNELIRKTEKEIALASYTAKERLLRFREEFAPLENLVPHPVIASYLGITNVSLSRLRGENKK